MLKIVDIPQLGEDASVDMLGRVTIPIQIRKKMGIVEGKKVQVAVTKEGIFIRNNNDDDDVCKQFIEYDIENVIEKYVYKMISEKEEKL